MDRDWIRPDFYRAESKTSDGSAHPPSGSHPPGGMLRALSRWSWSGWIVAVILLLVYLSMSPVLSGPDPRTRFVAIVLALGASVATIGFGASQRPLDQGVAVVAALLAAAAGYAAAMGGIGFDVLRIVVNSQTSWEALGPLAAYTPGWMLAGTVVTGGLLSAIGITEDHRGVTILGLVPAAAAALCFGVAAIARATLPL